MKKLLLTTLTVIGLCATANATHFMIKVDQDGNKEYLRDDSDEKSLSSLTRGDEELFTITPRFIYDEAKGIKPSPGQEAVSSDGSTSYSYLAFGDYVVFPWEMPAGEYDFLFSFESPEGYLLVAKEGVKIEGDTEIEVNAADAYVNHIEWDAVMPDGSSPMTGQPNGRRDVELGIHVFHTPNLITMYSFFYSFIKEDTTDFSFVWDKQQTIWINDASKFFISQIASVIENGAQYYINMPAIGTSTQKIINDKNNFKHYTLNQPDDWATITGGKEPLKRSYYDYYGFIGTKQFLSINAATDIPSEKLYDQVYYCAPGKDVYCPLTLKPGLEIFTDFDPSKGGQFGITPPALEFTESGGFQFQTFRQNNSHDSFSTNYNTATDNKSRPGLNPFIALAENENPVFGSTTPFVLFSRPGVYFGFDYIGQCGELRTLDYLNQKFSIRLNNEEVWTDYLDQRNFFYTEDWQPGIAFEKGFWEYEIESGNLTVDGLPSNTHCLMQFGESDDFTWPTITALQFRDKNGNVTERFENPSDGKMIFMGGEWSANENFPSLYECVAPKGLMVEYAPYGSEDFQILDYEAVPEKRYMPGYGDYYEVQLTQAVAESETGWYAVRLTMTDSQGNRQTQTVTPAFYVAKVSSANEVDYHNPLEIKIENGKIIAPDDVMIYNIEGKQIMSNRVAPGVYIVKRGAESVKALVR